MGAFKPSVADSLTVLKVPSLPQDVVRLTDLNASLEDVPTVGQMNSAIAYVAQGPTQITPDNSLIVSTLSPNTFQIQARLSPDGVTQAAKIDLHGVQSVVSAWTEIILGYQQVSNLVITRNLIAGDAVTFTGVQGVDYYLDAFNGIITITPNSGLINSAESPQTTQIEIVFDCAEIDSGGGLQVVGGSSGGLEVVWGFGHDQVPPGDVVQELLDNMHLPASPDPAAVTTVTTVDEFQRVRVEVKVEVNGGIEISSDGGLAIDVPAIIDAVEAATPDASSSTAGYMTPEQVVILGALSNQVPLTWGTTDSVALQVDGSGNVTADVIAGIGITIGSVAESGNSVDGLFGDEDIWYDLSLNADTWPAGWPNVVYWGIGVVGDVITFSIYSDSGGSNLLASGTASVAALLGARTPQNLNLYDLSATLVASLLINTVTAFPVYSTQSIVLTATGVSADLTVLALKSTTDLQQVQIDQLETESSSTSSAIAVLDAEVAALGGTVLTPTNLNDFNCLATLLEKWEFAHRFVPELRLELPNIGSPTGGQSPAPEMVPIRQIVTSGDASNIYTVDFQIRGVALVRDIWPATAAQTGEVIAGTSGRAVKNGTPYIVTLDSIDSQAEQTQDPFIQGIENALNEMIAVTYADTWALVISDNGTGHADTYYLNAAVSNSESLGGPQIIAYTLPSVPIKGGATASLVMISSGQATLHDLIVPNAAPYPESFPGYFMEVDALDVQNVCPIGDIAADGNADGIGKWGGTTRKDLDAIYGGSTGAYIGSANNYPALNASPEAPGFNGAVIIGTDGTEIPSGNALVSTPNQPVISLPRDLLRLGLIDGGNADDWVYDILINGKDIWVAGAFSRWGNTACPGLVRLDHLGRLAYDFNNARAAFSEPVRRLALASDGSVLAASIFSSMYQNNRSCQVHKIFRDGTEDTSFTPSDQMAINDTAHPNLVIDIAGLIDGKVAVLTPRGLTALNPDGTVFSQQDSGDTDMFLALLGVPGTTSLLLSSHAWSSLNQPCLFGSANIPRGLKLLDEGGSNFQIDSAWANPAYIGLPSLGAGTGAMASCMRAIAAADNSYFIVGNGLERYNGVDTSWNTQILGNLLRYSEAVNNTAAWSQYGTTSITPWFPGAPAGVSGATHAWVLLNTGGLGFQSFVQQSATVAAGATCIFEFYLLKRTPTGYPVVQMQFAGSSSGASTGGGGGTPIEAYAWLDPSGVHATPLVVNVSGGGNPQVTMIDAPTDPTNWWYVTFTLTNASADTDCNVTIFPAYSATWGGTSTSVNDGNAIAAPSLIYNFWSAQYVPTTSSPALPTESASNSNQFQGLYKILFDGAADPNFECTMTYGDDGMAMPFAIDGHGNIYCGGPITSIKDSAGAVHQTTPWMLYKLNSNGQFLAQYNLFDDAVLVARITPYGNLVVGGKFQFYGSYACGRFVMIDPWGNLIRDPIVLDDPVFTASASSFPDVLTLPGLKGKLLLDQFTDPPSEYVWSNTQGTWVQAGSGGFTQLPPVDITDSPAVPPNLWVPGESGFNGSSPLSIIMSDGIGGATIWYTEDGSDPRLTSNPARQQYPANASAGSYPQITTPTIITAYATKPGYADSVLSVATFGQTLASPVISPASQNVTSFPVLVTITGPVGAAIWYTTDGTNPATSGTASLYSGAFNVGNALSVGATVLAVAKQTGYFTSAIAQANYGENIMPDLVFTPAGGAAVPVSVVISLPATFTAQYNVVYTTSTTANPPNPLTNPSQAITAAGPVTLNLTVGTAIQAYATAPGYTPSPVATAAYGLAIVNAPTITLPPAGSGIGTIFIAADPTGPDGQSIVYTINGGQPVTANTPAAVDLSDVPGVNGVITITAYSTFPGWANSPTATAQEAPILLSGLIDVNFTPGTDTKVGRMAIFADPFKDVWNQVGASPGLIATLQENFYAGASGTAQAPGASVPTQLNFTPTTGEFGVIPFVGDLAYKNFLQIGATSSMTNVFGSAAYGLGIYAAISTGGGIWTSPDGNIWTETQAGFPALTRVVFASVPAIPATTYITTFTYAYQTVTAFLSANIPELAFFQAALPGFTFVSATANGVATDGLEPVVVVYSGPTAYPVLPSPPDPNYGQSQYNQVKQITAITSVTNNGVPGYAGFYITGAGVVLASTDGVNWKNITANLPLDFQANDIAITNIGGGAQVEVVGSGGRQFYSTVGSPSPYWTETTPTSNTGATLNSKVTCPFKAAQTQVAVGDAGTIYNFTGLVQNAYDQVSFMRVAANTSITKFCFVSRALNGITEAYTQTIGSSPTISPTDALPSGTTNLFDVCAYQFGFIAVGDKKILLGTMVSGTLQWQDITPVGAGGASSTGGSAWGSTGGDEGPMPFSYRGVTVGANGRVVVVGDEGIIYGNFNGSVWIWEWSNQMAGPASGTQEVLRGTFSNLTPGFYDLLLYGHGNLASENSAFHAYVDGVQVADVNDVLAPQTAADATFQNTNWELDRQFVEFGNLETIQGSIAFGVVPTGVTSTNYLIETVNWTEYGDGAGNGGAGTPSPTSGGSSPTLSFDSLSFVGTWPPGWPSTVYWSLSGTSGLVALQFSTDPSFATQLAYSYYNSTPVSEVSNPIVDALTSNTIGHVKLTGNGSSTSFTGSITLSGSAFGNLLGATADEISYSTTSTNPNVPVGSEIVSAATVGNITPMSGLTIPAGTSKEGGSATCYQLATREYLAGVLNSNTSGFINAIQLRRRQGAGVRMGVPVILPEGYDNLPFPKDVDGITNPADLIGIFVAVSDVALGIGPISNIYFRIDSCNYDRYQTYLASGASDAGLPPDPTASTGTLYQAPFAQPDNSIGIIIRAIATCVGRTTSNVASVFYFPAWPESSSWQ